MGCDIHTVWQANDADGVWYDIASEYDENRHYALFGVLAGVRSYCSDHEPISLPRGLPDNFAVVDGEYHPVPSHLAKKYDEDGLTWLGDHSRSWLLGSEMLAWSDANVNDLAYFFDEVRRLVAAHGEIRLVFGFDS